ncbi:dienelactone hydrolase endo-1,3,1,4-beta-D-glucanase [Marasmius fiardii PR-910]|nr:dienelactone hydrolase endo-1,3,1,4-beta-D-glucanase [Marasmius fiardii PR-910]
MTEPLCDNCFKGVTHEGTPNGKWEEIGGINCYVAVPNDNKNPDKILLFLPDAFGIQLINNQLLVSDFAANGIKTVAIDYFYGEPVPVEALSPGYSGPFNRETWFAKQMSRSRPAIDKVIEALKGDGITEFAATGYCWGGRYTFDLAFESIITTAIVSHPSRLKVPEDLQEYLEKSKAPLLINSCTVDAQFPLEAQAKADEILGDGKFKPGYKREYFDGCEHGFAVRGDLSNPKVKAGKEGSFKASVEWLKAYCCKNV